jgi:hypothetical protein
MRGGEDFANFKKTINTKTKSSNLILEAFKKYSYRETIPLRSTATSEQREKPLD